MVTANRSFKLSMIALMLAMPSAFCIRTWGQEAPAVAASNTQTNGAPDDWSFHHLVFSNPGTREDAVKEGRLDQWLKITADRRYQMQQRRRSGTQQAVAEAGEAAAAAKKTKTPLKKDWSTTLSGTVATLTGTVGTLSSSSISGSSTLTVDGVTLSASAPTSAMSTGTFLGLPTSTTAPTITVNGGGQTMTLTTNATAKTATGTITAGAPLTNQTILIPSSAGSITLTPGGTAATLVGNISGVISSGIQVGYNNGGGTANTLSLTPTGETQGNVVGTFTASGGSGGQFTPVGTFKVTSGSNTATLTPNGYAYFTISSTPHTTDTVTIAVTGGSTYTYAFVTTPSMANQVAIGSSAATAAQNLAAAVMADSTMCATSSCFGSLTTKPSSISASYGSTDTYIFNSTSTTITLSDNNSSRIGESTTSSFAAGSNSCSGSGSNITGGFAAVATPSGGGSSSAVSMAAALNLCSNLGMTATYTTSTQPTVTVTNTAYGPAGTVSATEGLSGFSLGTPTQGTANNGCSSSTTGTFGTYTGITTTTQAANIAAAIGSCDSSYSVVGATASSSGAAFTVTAAAPGSAVTLSGTGPSGISWTPASGNASGTDTGAGTCTSSATGTFVNNGAASTLATNIYNTLASTSCTTTYPSGVIATHSANTLTVTANVLGSSPTFTTAAGTATVFTWGSVSGGSAGTTTCTGTGPWTATFMTGTTTMATAANLTSAITQSACSGASSTITATGDAVASTAVPGSGASLTVGASSNANIFSWSAVTTGTDGTNSSTTFAYWSVNTYLTPTLVAANITSAINANPTLQVLTSGVSATSSGASVKIAANAAGTGGNSYAVSESNFSAWSPTGDLSAGGSGSPAARVQPNTYPAKFSFYTGSANASCSDFVVYPTGVTGSATNANIIAYNNLYVSGCSGANPSAYWAYNTGGAVSTSPILSFDSTGSQVAYVQVSGSTASLVILKWAANPSASVGTPLTLTATSNTNYPTCANPCYTAVSLGANDTFSSPYYDYSSDTAYVGDDSGNLHAITGVFNGTPTLDAGSIFPVNLGSKQLSSPVADPTWVGGQVFVGDMGGVLHCVNLSTGVVTATASFGTAIADAPLINSSANYVIAFWTGTTNAVYGFSEQYFPGGQGGPVAIGAGGSGSYYQYAGTFDNVYYESPNATGNIYVVGNTGTAGGGTLYQVGLSGGFLTGGVTSVVTGLNSTERPWPSPVTEFCNNGTSACALQTASGCSLSHTSTTISCTTASFTSGDVGASVTGTDIPAGATVSTYVNPTSIKISTDPSATTSGVTLTLGATGSGTDYLFFSVNVGTTSEGCTSSSGNGCILAYNASYPGSVPEAGTGLNVTTPGTNGCWATGGLIIDNSAPSGTLAGASQVYFVNLNGNAAGNSNGVSSSGCTSPSTVSIIDGVQAAQSSP